MAAFGIVRLALYSTLMKRLSLLVFLPLVLFVQDQLSTTDIAALKAELENLKAQYDVLKAKNDLATLELGASPAEAKAKAEKDARDKVTVDTINAISGLASNPRAEGVVLISLDELEQIRRLWFTASRELDDTLPAIYEFATGRLYPGGPLPKMRTSLG